MEKFSGFRKLKVCTEISLPLSGNYFRGATFGFENQTKYPFIQDLTMCTHAYHLHTDVMFSTHDLKVYSLLSFTHDCEFFNIEKTNNEQFDLKRCTIIELGSLVNG